MSYGLIKPCLHQLLQFLSGFMPRDSEDDDDEDEEDDDHSTEEQLAPQLIRSVSGTRYGLSSREINIPMLLTWSTLFLLVLDSSAVSKLKVSPYSFESSFPSFPSLPFSPPLLSYPSSCLPFPPPPILSPFSSFLPDPLSRFSLPSLADSQSSIPSSLRSSFRQLRYGSPFRLFTRSQNNSNGNDNGVDGASSATPSSRATAGSGEFGVS